ncbi:hypothetical protein BS78_02G230000 [Paspalum vaginatum]|nr:hypothetical protein BS78_02G230000 [Paspalum vaginatum]KAJ1290266.1 hypothetical protein BS78_02G230000 [Paspalum vaginatum]
MELGMEVTAAAIPAAVPAAATAQDVGIYPLSPTSAPGTPPPCPATCGSRPTLRCTGSAPASMASSWGILAGFISDQLNAMATTATDFMFGHSQFHYRRFWCIGHANSNYRWDKISWCCIGARQYS